MYRWFLTWHSAQIWNDVLTTRHEPVNKIKIVDEQWWWWFHASILHPRIIFVFDSDQKIKVKLHTKNIQFTQNQSQSKSELILVANAYDHTWFSIDRHRLPSKARSTRSTNPNFDWKIKQCQASMSNMCIFQLLQVSTTKIVCIANLRKKNSTEFFFF